MAYRPHRTTPGIGLFAVFVFVLVAVPKMNVKLGPVPVYMIDLLILMLIVKAQSLPAVRGRRMFSTTVKVILSLALASEVIGVLTFSTLQDSLYISIRTCLAFSVFFLTGLMVRTPQDVSVILRAAVLGMLVTAALMILTSLPMTRVLVVDLVFSNKFLEPAAEGVGANYSAGDSGVRGRTLVGVSILGASFINVCWPLAALLLRWPWRLGPVWRGITLAACLLAPMGVVMSYSRGPILGSLLILLAVLLYGFKHVRRGILLPVAVSTTVILAVGITSQLFFFDRLSNRSQAILENPFQDERESERILAYIEPFQHVAEQPQFLLLGEGITVRYSDTRAVPEQAGKATHAAFAMAYYSYGMLAALLYGSLVLRALRAAGQLARRKGSFAGLLSQSLLLSVVALLPWVAFGHAPVSTPRGAMLFFLVIGLISSLANFFEVPRQVKPANRRSHAQHRAPAFR
ncbi:O-antigen ligase family protein [Leisingera aquaemixtae]|uniref:Lipid A core-O-antigen ligase n=1 Tax=Leisingera aquaemixtae TaxID=1396826 RepID=A0A0P1H4S7_9RHOB|nr:O-antigen ligase family protein [Leisingera aquaemixtae]UWQ39567.1 O-antigen ligase family protein [Leisingera aquaemixtae]CUH97905.1 Lipid A core-O-antigen ligase [Leisingera aquaemixtae]